MEDNEELVEQIAEAIYRNKGGVAPEEFEEITGKRQKDWKTDLPWDSNPDELCEWERDEYRQQAEAVLKVLDHDGLRRTVKEVIQHLEASVVVGRAWNEGQEQHAHFVLPIAAKLRVALGDTTVRDPRKEQSVHDFPLNGLVCSVCGEPQHETPYGDVCENGHGGAPGVDPNDSCPSCGGSGSRSNDVCDACGGKGTIG